MEDIIQGNKNPKRLPEVESEVNALTSVIVYQDQILSDLEGRLSMIIKPRELEKEKVGEEVSLVPLAEAIRSLRIKIESNNAYLGELISRIEL
jgi:hypothetical protein